MAEKKGSDLLLAHVEFQLDASIRPRRRRLTAEHTEHAEKKMASTNYMKFDFSESAPDHDPGISAVRHSA
jgi:hypothetical protein